MQTTRTTLRQSPRARTPREPSAIDRTRQPTSRRPSWARHRYLVVVASAVASTVGIGAAVAANPGKSGLFAEITFAAPSAGRQSLSVRVADPDADAAVTVYVATYRPATKSTSLGVCPATADADEASRVFDQLKLGPGPHDQTRSVSVATGTYLVCVYSAPAASGPAVALFTASLGGSTVPGPADGSGTRAGGSASPTIDAVQITRNGADGLASGSVISAPSARILLQRKVGRRFRTVARIRAKHGRFTISFVARLGVYRFIVIDGRGHVSARSPVTRLR